MAVEKGNALMVSIELGNRVDAFEVRRAVFIEEQGYENEYDGIDDAAGCIHVTAYVDGELAGCARTFSHETERAVVPEAHALPACNLDGGANDAQMYLLGRVAVLPEHRRSGVAGALISAAEEAARAAGARVMKLHAQEYVRALYEKHGYEQISEVDYEDEGQPHLWMAKRL